MSRMQFQLLRHTSLRAWLDALVLESFTSFGRSRAQGMFFMQKPCLKIFFFAQNFLVPEIQHFQFWICPIKTQQVK